MVGTTDLQPLLGYARPFPGLPTYAIRLFDRLQIMFVFYVTFAVVGVHHGTGQHVWEIQPPTEVPVGLKV